ncbi:unnamed protein product, partial [Musa acuminata subsp. burmannicoides]
MVQCIFQLKRCFRGEQWVIESESWKIQRQHRMLLRESNASSVAIYESSLQTKPTNYNLAHTSQMKENQNEQNRSTKRRKNFSIREEENQKKKKKKKLREICKIKHDGRRRASAAL